MDEKDFQEILDELQSILEPVANIASHHNMQAAVRKALDVIAQASEELEDDDYEDDDEDDDDEVEVQEEEEEQEQEGAHGRLHI